MTINQFSSLLYRMARLSRDVRAVERSLEKGSIEPIASRVGRKLTGRLMGRLMSALFPAGRS